MASKREKTFYSNLKPCGADGEPSGPRRSDRGQPARKCWVGHNGGLRDDLSDEHGVHLNQAGVHGTSTLIGTVMVWNPPAVTTEPLPANEFGPLLPPMLVLPFRYAVLVCGGPSPLPVLRL